MGRQSGEVRLEVLKNTTQKEVGEAIVVHRRNYGTCYSDESKAYNYVQTDKLAHKTVCHSIKEWARDDDGDGINEVHTNTIEGFWTELRNFLRQFKGVSKHYIHLYVAIFEWMYNGKIISPDIIQALTFSPKGT